MVYNIHIKSITRVDKKLDLTIFNASYTDTYLHQPLKNLKYQNTMSFTPRINGSCFISSVKKSPGILNSNLKR